MNHETGITTVKQVFFVVLVLPWLSYAEYQDASYLFIAITRQPLLSSMVCIAARWPLLRSIVVLNTSSMQLYRHIKHDSNFLQGLL